MLHARLALTFVLAAILTVAARTQNSMRNSVDTPPPAWTGLKFELSKAYPAARPAPGNLPWKAFDIRTQPKEYIMAVRDYALEGNVEVNWVVQNNATRVWFHVPGMAAGASGREFIRGMTRERVSRARELHPSQTERADNWAVGMYNPMGGHVIGQVWANPREPDASKAAFRDGTVALKLLFTTASVAQVPYLDGSPTWEGNIGDSVAHRSPQTLRLLQMDIAVRDSRNNSLTGWVFGTFVYQNTAPGTDPWRKLLPVGLQWGNDPTVTPKRITDGVKLKQCWINPEVTLPHLGWLGRLNGPVDNPASSCLSCHALAGVPQTNAMVPASSADDAQKMQFFRNIKAGMHPLPNTASLDYSLQLGIGIRNFPGSAGDPTGMGDPAPAASDATSLREGPPAPASVAFVPVSPDTDGSDDEEAATSATRGASSEPAAARTSVSMIYALVLGAIVIAVIVAFVVRRNE